MASTMMAQQAIEVYQQRTRSRALAAVTDRIADGMFAAGGILLADATFALNLGLPQGRVGASLGGALIAGALAWMKRHSSRSQQANRARRVQPQPQPRLAIVIPFDRAA
ncbi:MAG: hypothetical protein ACLGH3_02585 [Actinomycetota bacterium]